MASKFNINIKGSPQSVFMGDNAVVNINRHSNRGDSRPGPPWQAGRVPHAQESSPSNMSEHSSFQETMQTDGGDYQPMNVKISHGFALIIHNHYLKNISDGSKVDSQAIKDFCGDAGLVVNDTDLGTEDLTANEIETLCNELSKRDFHDFDGFLCFILSHGNDSTIYGINDMSISIDRIVNTFKRCLGLVNKPKLFFIQVCLGKNGDYGLEADSPQDTQNEDVSPLRLPTDSDTLVAYSSVSRNDSEQLSEDGSWFIQTLLSELKEHGHDTHLMNILTRVNKKVAHLYAQTSTNGHFPCQLSTLTKFVYLNYPPPLSKESGGGK